MKSTASLAPADHAELGPALAQSQQQRTAGIALAAVDALAAGTDHLAARQITAVGLLAFIERHERHLHRLQLGGIDPAIADVGVAPADHGEFASRLEIACIGPQPQGDRLCIGQRRAELDQGHVVLQRVAAVECRVDVDRLDVGGARRGLGGERGLAGQHRQAGRILALQAMRGGQYPRR
ncbi:hypothetical protein G6F31_019011 [Rhizopus arrhizus]|nr:hypothetical protein G6F31_019011 [Rhizopus arrhizus]